MTLVETLAERGLLSEIDCELAEALGRVAGERDERVLLAAALASAAVQGGHTCADLEAFVRKPLHDDAGEPIAGLEIPELEGWLDALARSRLVAREGRTGEARPLVLGASSRIYLARYHEYERRLAEALLRRVGQDDRDLDAALLRADLDRLFAPDTPGEKEQRRAALVALLSRMSVISGGPGTGKTFTVAKILVLLQRQALAAGRAPYRVELLAPTGKAAQRLGEAIQRNIESLERDPKVLESVPRAAATIHRVLGYRPRTPTRFRHDRDDPLPSDVVVVDEASMVDLALMSKLVEAIPEKARLVLLGDKDQLASVEAGSILADLYAGSARGVSAACAERIGNLTGEKVSAGSGPPSLADGMIELSHSHRFREGSGIHELARAVNAGDARRALAVLAESSHVTLEPLPEPERFAKVFGPLVEERFGRLAAAALDDKLGLLERFRLLCVHRRGPYGVETLNDWVAAELRRRGALELDGDFYDGRPLIVTANDYQTELYNGDVGVVGRELPNGALLARFAGAAGRRNVSLALLPPHETAFAMSVHKAQGSEFDEVALLLGKRPSPILTRELIYTAVTRARTRVRVFGSPEIFATAVETRVERASGLRDRLWDASG